MDKIICLVGASGCGKTTIAKKLDKLGYNIIHSYTTRKPREPNEWGHTFIDNIKEIIDIDYNDLFKKNTLNYMGNKVIAFKQIYGNMYFATEKQYQNKGISIYVVDPEGAKQVQKNVKDAKVITIFLIADEEVREERLKDRAYKNRGIPEHISIKNYEKFQKIMQEIEEEIDNRLMKDIKLFSKCKCNYAVDANRNIEEVIADVKEIIGDIDE